MQLEPAYGEINRGEALIWHANLLHGGAPTRVPGRSRHSQVTHYFFEGCRYYTPMESTPRFKAWRTPLWIPNTVGERPLARELTRSIVRRVRKGATRLAQRIF